MDGGKLPREIVKLMHCRVVAKPAIVLEVSTHCSRRHSEQESANPDWSLSFLGVECFLEHFFSLADGGGCGVPERGT